VKRRVCLVLVVLLVSAAGGASSGAADLRIDTHVTLARDGQGDVVMDIVTDLDRIKDLPTPVPSAVGLTGVVPCQLLAAQTRELKAILEKQGLTGVAVRQSLANGIQTSRVRAHVEDVGKLCTFGGELTFEETSKGFLELNGTLGGRPAAGTSDEACLKMLRVTLTFEFPGTVAHKDDEARLSHSGRAVTYAWTGQELLGGTTEAHVRVVPDIEGAPYFWLVLILGVAALVVLGTFILLRYGRKTVNAGSNK